MNQQKYERNPSLFLKTSRSNSEDLIPQSTQPTVQRPRPSEESSDSSYMRIITSLNDPDILKLKRGKNTPSIHIFTLRKYMEEFKDQYIRRDKNGKQIANYYEDDENSDGARTRLLKITDPEPTQNNYKKQPKRRTVNTKDLEKLFGGNKPDINNEEEVKSFIIRRMNARVLELIYQKYQVEIMFGSSKNQGKLANSSSKMEDKLTNSLFIYEYRTRLPNPLLCGGLECIRPMEKQTKYKKKPKEEVGSKKTKGIKKQ